MSETILEMLHGECVARPGRLETARWRLRWDADCVVAVRVGSLDEPVRSDGRGLIVQVARALAPVRAPTVARLFGGSAGAEAVHQLHVELRGRDLGDRVRLWAQVDAPARLEGLDELALDEADEVESLGVLTDLLETAVALGAGLALSGGSEVSARSLEALRQERDGQLVAAGRLRRERDALAARVESLDAELSASRARVSALEALASENARLQRQVDWLDTQLQAARRASAPPVPQTAPTVTAHNLAQTAPPPGAAADGDAGPEVVCGACLGRDGQRQALVTTGLRVDAPPAVLHLACCPRCGAAQFVRTP